MWTALWEPLLRVDELAKKLRPGAQLRPSPLLMAISHTRVLVTHHAGRVWSGSLQPFLGAGSWLCHPSLLLHQNDLGKCSVYAEKWCLNCETGFIQPILLMFL